MGRQAAVVLYALALVTVVVGVDILFFRHHFWARLIVNVGIVLVFAAFLTDRARRAPKSAARNPVSCLSDTDSRPPEKVGCP
jgi:glucose dehydrogenase